MADMTQKKATDWTQDDAETLFLRYARHRDPQMRDRLVVMHQNLVRYLAGKFVNRGEPLEDLDTGRHYRPDQCH